MPENETPFANNTVKDLTQAHHLLKNISLIIQILNEENVDLNTSLNRILSLLLEYLGVEQGSIMVLEKRMLVVAAATRTDLIGKKQPIDDSSIAAWVARTGIPIFIPDISKDERFPARSGFYKKNAVLSAPILQNKKLLGVINATDKGGDKDLLKEDIAYLLDFSSLIISILVQKKMQQELQRQRNILKKKNQELKLQEKLRDDLYRLLIHDLKTPLAEVVANLDILSYSIKDENREFLESAQIGCDRTVRMISNLITINKIEDGKIKLSLEDVSIPSLLDEARSAITGLARIKDVSIITKIANDLPSLFIDRVLLLRVLQNLLTNSLSYTKEGTHITLGCRLLPGKKKQIDFFVQDQGSGIAKEQQKSIFDKYSRISTQQDALVGTGLGLYFCKLAVELHHGIIGIDSSPGHGCTFHFTLPAE
ncbi:MAG: GAF domain-containing sensor histidine kinase [Proteobacteria bacterium]|nr:GAF domain-containing sensor histidine kinase [Desulfobulbaceae bacterium]MBU4151945.1 GAF domain-containing sensor histidine kinase [Pseudomonadota bacterium]MDP2107131.1 GAF domain-containing sensor histidine kinase [Desulfobulbaceae bacterium]